MFTAKQKRKENIVEYILYLFQIEDLIRAFQLDLDQIKNKLITQYKTDDLAVQNEIFAWYENLVLMIKKEGIVENGHFQFLVNLINELNEFHLKLLETGKVPDYLQTYQTISGLITELRIKGNGHKNNVHTSLEAIYGYLLLKMQHKQVSAGTHEAMQSLNNWLAKLSVLFKEFEDDKLDLD